MEKTIPDSVEVSIPKTLRQCTEVDAVSQTLWNWAHRFDLWGRILFYVIVTIGILSTIVDSIYTYYILEDMDDLGLGISLLALVGQKIPVVSTILRWGLYAFLTYLVFHMLALGFGALATLTHTSTVTANVALFNSISKPKVIKANDKSDVNSPTEPVKTSEPFKPPVPPAPGFWVCKTCGTHNKDTYYQCKTCTQYRIN